MLTRRPFKLPTSPADLGRAILEYLNSLNLPDSLTITKATIDSSVIGGTAAAAGTFTNLTTTGNSILGDAATDTLAVSGIGTFGGLVAQNMTATADMTIPSGYGVIIPDPYNAGAFTITAAGTAVMEVI